MTIFYSRISIRSLQSKVTQALVTTSGGYTAHEQKRDTSLLYSFILFQSVPGTKQCCEIKTIQFLTSIFINTWTSN